MGICIGSCCCSAACICRCSVLVGSSMLLLTLLVLLLPLLGCRTAPLRSWTSRCSAEIRACCCRTNCLSPLISCSCSCVLTSWLCCCLVSAWALGWLLLAVIVLTVALLGELSRVIVLALLAVLRPWPLINDLGCCRASMQHLGTAGCECLT